MRSVLLFNLYPKNNWEEVTNSIIGDVPHHQDIYVNVSLDINVKVFLNIIQILIFLKKFGRIRKIFFSINRRKLSEYTGFEKMRREIDFTPYQILTYTHSKGVTKPNNPNIQDWVRMMRYFVIERHDLCIKSFKRGYALYGSQLNKYEYERPRNHTYKFCDFWYAGTFVSIDLRKLRKEFDTKKCIKDYFGVEAFWGNLCSVEKAFSVHNSPFSLYDHPYPAERYVSE